ncbi:hypothetical protein [Cesiribacter sp. SM1]|uniref:hypothetical protein n=1 Tax=Cesiribacter sp. SM1 TaxID=2861196 RepID=UPI001CD804C5|nr:hypothetical protein [Cesiribacter sp. SM1]
MYVPLTYYSITLRLLLSIVLSFTLFVSAVQAQHQHSNVKVYSANRESSTQLKIQNDNESLNVEIDGTITIGPDDRSISAISEGGFLKIKKTTFGNTREIFIKNTGGTLSHEYKEGGRTVPFEPAGKAWLADILPELLRNTTIGAESRVDRFYQRGGVRAVLVEMGNIKSDHVKAKYAELLLKKNIKESEVPSVIEAIGKQVDSDFYRYEIFKNNSDKLLANQQNMGQYLNAINTVQSDHYKTELVKLAFSKNLPAQYNKQALQLIGTINSDHYKSEVLKRMVRSNQLTDEQLEFLLGNLLQTVNSDHYRTETISMVLNTQKELSPAGVTYVISSINQTGSAHYATESLKKLIKTHKLSIKNYEALFGTLNKLQSDHYKSEFMRMLVADPAFEEHFDLFLRESQNIRSDHNRSEVLRAALNEGSLNDDQLAKLAASASTIQSDHNKSEVLLQVCHKSKSEKVKKAVQEAAKSINSTFNYGNVMKCAQ